MIISIHQKMPLRSEKQGNQNDNKDLLEIYRELFQWIRISA